MKIKFDKKTFLNTLWVIALCTAWFSIGWVANIRLGDSGEKIIDSAYELVSKEALYNQQSNRDLSYAAIRGMLSSLNDPYAELIEPQAAKGMLNAFAGNTGVIGMYAENQNGQVVILSVFPGGPAEMSGLEVGDVIVSIDGKPLDKDSDSSETGLLIRGAPGTSVTLEILREGQRHKYHVTRQAQEYVQSSMHSNGIGYISLNAFNDVASQQMKRELESLLDQQPSGLILDLRNNEGGDMQAAQEILSYFIEDGLLFSAQLTQDRVVQFFAKGNALAAQIPLVVLIDHTTYSAAEATAAAIAETGRGTTVGSTSFGKGLIQATLPLGDDALLQMTIAKWLSTDGEWYHKRGVDPQVEVHDDPTTLEDEVMQKAVQILLSGS